MISLSFQWLSRDGKLILAARIARTFGYGFLSVILSIYLKLIGYNELLIGLILSFALVNSVIFTLIASFYADRLGRRKMLIIYAGLMAVSGAIFFVTNNYVALIVLLLLGRLMSLVLKLGLFFP